MTKINFFLIGLILTIITFSFTATEEVYAQKLTITLHQPPPGKFGFADFWSVTTNNLSNETFRVVLSGTLKEQNAGLVATAISTDIELKPGTKNIKASDFPVQPEVSYPNPDPKYKETLIRTGNLPPGSYNYCVFIKFKSNHEEIGSDCIDMEIIDIGTISLINPGNDEVVNFKTPVIFTWIPGKPQQGEKFNFRIVEMTNGQTPEVAITQNRIFFEKNEILGLSFNYPSSAPQFTEGKKYAWYVFTKTNNNQNINSEVWSFTSSSNQERGNGTENAITKFEMNGYPITVNSVIDKNINNFCGHGIMSLWQGGPEISLTFNNLELSLSSENNWIVTFGEIIQTFQLNQPNIILPMKEEHDAQGNAIFKITKIFLSQPRGRPTKDVSIEGHLEWQIPLAVIVQNKIKSEVGILKAKYIDKIYQGQLNLNQNYSFDIVDPLGFQLNLDHHSSSFSFSNNQVELNFAGNIKLPQNSSDVNNNRIELAFTSMHNLVYFKVPTSIMSQSQGIRLIPNTNVTILPIECLFDFSDDKSPSFNSFNKTPQWKGVKFTIMNIGFPQNISNDIKLPDSKLWEVTDIIWGSTDMERAEGYVSAQGNGFAIFSFRQIGFAKYKTFKGSLGSGVFGQNGIVIKIVDGIISNSYLRGYLKIPFISDSLEYQIPLSQNGLENGYILESSLGQKKIYETTLLNAQEKLHVNVNQAVFLLENRLKMNVDFDFQGKFVFPIAQKINIGNLIVWSDGLLAPEGALDQWYTLPSIKPCKFKNFSAEIKKIKIQYVSNQKIYKFYLSGGIALAENLHNFTSLPNSPVLTEINTLGTELNQLSGALNFSVEYWANVLDNGKLEYNSFHLDDIALNFNSSSFKFSASVNLYENDPIYGDGFKGATSVTIKPFSSQATGGGSYQITGILYIGKIILPTPYNYWFVESGYTDANGYTIPYTTLTLHGFTGRAYWHMRHLNQPQNVLSTDFIPDNSVKLGLLGLIPISIAGKSKILWGYNACEFAFNTSGGLNQITLYGDAYILSPGIPDKNAKIIATGTIGYYRPAGNLPYFLGTLDGHFNLEGAICGDGKLGLKIAKNEWYLNQGSNDPNQLPGTKDNLKIFCKDNWKADAYFMLNHDNIKFGTGLYLGTGNQEDTVTSNLISYYNYSCNFNVDNIGTYSPLSFQGTSQVSGTINHGYKFELPYLGWQKIELFSGNMQTQLVFTMPPLCISTTLHPTIRIFLLGNFYDITFDLKVKNGEFSMGEGTCP